MRRGDIYFIHMPQTGENSCEQGYRPVVVVSSNRGCDTCDAIMVCPITTQRKPLSCNVEIDWTIDNRPSQVLCNQVTTVPKDILVDYKGFLRLDEQRKISVALLISLGIKVNYNEVRL